MEDSFGMDPCRCPLCGGPNACAMASPATGQSPQPCWCVRETFSPALLQRLPPQAQGKACICQACVKVGQSQQT